MYDDDSQSDNTQSYVPLTKDTKVGHFRIIDKIGAGGMGEVYLAEDTELKRNVALKFMPVQFINNKSLRERFSREARAVATLNHPNIVTIYDVGEFNNRPFFAMEHVEGKPLRDIIKKGKLTTTEAIDLIMQICEGLQEAHEAGVVHRDIKPGNIIIDRKGKPHLLDFGLAMVVGEEKLTKTGSTLGTVGYMAPEQISGKQVDHRSDIFSVGVILYEMVTGRKPFEGDNDAAVVRAITSSTPDPIARFKSGVTGELQLIIDKALSKDISIRYQHADGMLADLRRLKSETITKKKSKLGLWITSAVIIISVGGYFGYSKFFIERPETDNSKRLVVLPFDNIGEEDQDYFASGMTDEVISKLTNIKDLNVVSRISAAKLKQEGKSIKEIGDALGVEYILDASARYQESSDGIRHIRLVTQLINVTNDQVIWSETYDTVMTKIFDVQSQIAEQVAEQMDIVLLDADRQKVWEKWTDNEKAWDYYRRGRNEAQRNWYDKKQLLRALKLYKQAIELDSNFVWPYVHITDIYGRMYAFHSNKTDSFKTLSLWAAEKSAELSDNVQAINYPMGRYNYLCEKNFEKALEFFEKAFEGDKENSGYINLTHHCLRRMGRWEEAYEYMHRVIELEPKWLDPKLDLAIDCWYMRKYEEAINLLKESIMESPGRSNAYLDLANLYYRWKGDVDSSKIVMEWSHDLIDSTRWKHWKIIWSICEGKPSEAKNYLSIPNFDSASYYRYMAWVYRSENDTAMAYIYSDSLLPLAQSYMEKYPDYYRSHITLATAYAHLGNREKALQEGKEAMRLMPLSNDAIIGTEPINGMVKIYTYLGDLDNALTYLDSVMSIPSELGLGELLTDPDNRSLVKHEGFKEIMEKYADTAQWRLYEEKVGSL